MEKLDRKVAINVSNPNLSWKPRWQRKPRERDAYKKETMARSGNWLDVRRLREREYDCVASKLGVLRNSDAIKRVKLWGRKRICQARSETWFLYFELRDKTNFQWKSIRQLEIMNRNKSR